MNMPNSKYLSAMVALLLLPSLAHAWWNNDWTHRKQITVTVPADIKQGQKAITVPIRLHTGNFVFTDAESNGSDLRFVAGDDKTPLKFHLEKFDDINELAVAWVQLPSVTPGTKPDSLWLYYGNPKAVPGSEAKTSYDPDQTLVLHFTEKEGPPKDATAYANNANASTASHSTAGLLGEAASFDGQGKIVVPNTPSLSIGPSTGFTFSAWLKPTELQKNATLLSRVDGNQSVQLGLADGHVNVTVNGATGAYGQLLPGGWHQLVLTVKDQATVYIDGKSVGSAPVTWGPLAGDILLGNSAAGDAGYKGLLDEVTLAKTVRSGDWVATEYAAAAADGKLLAVSNTDEGSDADSGSASYFGVILHSVTLDGWVVIGILMVMMVIAFWVMAAKAVFIVRMESANKAFREEFRRMAGELVSMDRGEVEDEEDEDAEVDINPEAVKFQHSSLYRVYHVGVRELLHRFELYDRAGRPRTLTGPALNAIKASVDAGLVREGNRLNNQMVLLTIAISGGPFLGLLGTVVGVMITFAAIAAAGDVNVNAIAPGIAAALVATVAGLGVAIPSLFGYNYLSSRIKNVSSELHIFADEFITKLAEDYSI